MYKAQLGVKMIKLFRIVLSGVGIMLASYCLITKNFELMPYLLIIMGVNYLITWRMEIQLKRKTNAVISFFAGAFALFVGIYTFITDILV